jgi:hypothetical protein
LGRSFAGIGVGAGDPYPPFPAYPAIMANPAIRAKRIRASLSSYAHLSSGIKINVARNFKY